MKTVEYKGSMGVCRKDLTVSKISRTYEKVAHKFLYTSGITISQKLGEEVKI